MKRKLYIYNEFDKPSEQYLMYDGRYINKELNNNCIYPDQEGVSYLEDYGFEIIYNDCEYTCRLLYPSKVTYGKIGRVLSWQGSKIFKLRVNGFDIV
jgi:hypothetical protein